MQFAAAPLPYNEHPFIIVWAVLIFHAGQSASIFYVCNDLVEGYWVCLRCFDDILNVLGAYDWV
jgi:hypothetical protein